MMTETKIALTLLSLTALVRLVGQILGIDIIGALALTVDVYALGLLLGLQRRQRAVSPFWLAILFAFALPLERVMQHTIGYSLQFISAAGACQILGLGTEFVQCQGVRILLAGKDVLVDLPCSGARGLLLLFTLFSALAAITRPTWYYASIGIGITLMAAFIVNVIRIVLLAIGLAYPNTLGGIDVMASPYHDLIGFTALAIGIIPVVLWAMKVAPSQVALLSFRTDVGNLIDINKIFCFTCNFVPKLATFNNKTARNAKRKLWQVRLIAFMFIILAIVIVNFPTYPIDVARKIEPPILPTFINNLPAIHVSLSPNEQNFFTQYGGGSAKANYGQFGLLLVSTSAPLRHLHTPMECLGYIGHKVRYVISTFGRIPTAIYHSTDLNGQQWQIRVTFVDENGTMTPYVSEVAWQWLQNRHMTWTMIQRIAPLYTPKNEIEEWDIAVTRALELPFYLDYPS
jgi:exosortase/archaeosortase family protein